MAELSNKCLLSLSQLVIGVSCTLCYHKHVVFDLKINEQKKKTCLGSLRLSVEKQQQRR